MSVIGSRCRGETLAMEGPSQGLIFVRGQTRMRCCRLQDMKLSKQQQQQQRSAIREDHSSDKLRRDFLSVVIGCTVPS